MTHRTSEAIKANNIALMGRELGEIYTALTQELVHLYYVWGQYEDLFASEEKVELLNRSAGSFFALAQDTLWKTVLLGICRLTDPVGQGRHRRLTINGLPKLLQTELRGAVQTKVDKAVGAQTFARDWRHRTIAHNDLELRISPHQANPLEDGTRARVDVALKALAEVLNAISFHYKDGEMAYDHAIPPTGDAEALLSVLKKGIAARDAELERIRARTASAEDLE